MANHPFLKCTLYFVYEHGILVDSFQLSKICFLIFTEEWNIIIIVQ